MVIKKKVKEYLDALESGETDLIRLAKLKYYYKVKKNLKMYLAIGEAVDLFKYQQED
jgi:hypothetical protein